MQEAYAGCEKEIVVPQLVRCKACSGSGQGEGEAKKGPCGYCVGVGTIRDPRLGVNLTCPTCNGDGDNSAFSACQTCFGRGNTWEEGKHKVRLAPGQLPGCHVAIGGTLVPVAVHLPPEWRNQGGTIQAPVQVTLLQALRGDPVEVTTAGGQISLSLVKGTRNGQVFRVAGKGLGGRDHMAVAVVHYPEDTGELIELLEKDESDGIQDSVPGTDG